MDGEEQEIVGTQALLPSDELVVIEAVHDDGYVTVRRIYGELAGTIALCKMSSLRLIEFEGSDDEQSSFE